MISQISFHKDILCSTVVQLIDRACYACRQCAAKEVPSTSEWNYCISVQGQEAGAAIAAAPQSSVNLLLNVEVCIYTEEIREGFSSPQDENMRKGYIISNEASQS